MKRGRWIWKVAAMVVIGIAFIALVGFVTQYLWNWLVPVLFSGPVISYWQALGLLLLSKILFSGFAKGRGHRHGGHWKPYLKSRWDSMSPEMKERFKQKMREKCGWNQPIDKPGDASQSM